MNRMTVMTSMVLVMLNQHELSRTCHRSENVNLPFLNDTSMDTYKTCTKNACPTICQATRTSYSS